jgi:hypothetical protein
VLNLVCCKEWFYSAEDEETRTFDFMDYPHFKIATEWTTRGIQNAQSGIGYESVDKARNGYISNLDSVDSDEEEIHAIMRFTIIQPVIKKPCTGWKLDCFGKEKYVKVPLEGKIGACFSKFDPRHVESFKSENVGICMFLDVGLGGLFTCNSSTLAGCDRTKYSHGTALNGRHGHDSMELPEGVEEIYPFDHVDVEMISEFTVNKYGGTIQIAQDMGDFEFRKSESVAAGSSSLFSGLDMTGGHFMFATMHSDAPAVQFKIRSLHYAKTNFIDS